MSAIYRVRQFALAVMAWTRPEDSCDAVLCELLPARAVELFRAMPSYDRRHALSTMRALERRGHRDSDLLAAALLHDVGKTAHADRPSRLLHRVAAVLVRAVKPGLLERIGQDKPGGWRQPFFVQQHHAAIGAELAQQVCCAPRTVDWIRRHEDLSASSDPLLSALQAADGES